MLRYAMLCYAMLCYAMLCYAMLCYAMLCYAMLCYAMLCYAMYATVIRFYFSCSNSTCFAGGFSDERDALLLLFPWVQVRLQACLVMIITSDW
jgi:hypothetical protein